MVRHRTDKNFERSDSVTYYTGTAASDSVTYYTDLRCRIMWRIMRNGIYIKRYDVLHGHRLKYDDVLYGTAQTLWRIRQRCDVLNCFAGIYMHARVMNECVNAYKKVTTINKIGKFQ